MRWVTVASEQPSPPAAHPCLFTPGSVSRWSINEVDGAMTWELVQKFKMEEDNTWTKVDLEAEEAEWQAEEVLSASEQKFKELDLGESMLLCHVTYNWCGGG